MHTCAYVMKWKYFPRYWPFVWGIHRSPVNSPHKGQWRGALMFSLICAWTNSCTNYGDAGDLRRYRAYYVTVMNILPYTTAHLSLISCTEDNSNRLYRLSNLQYVITQWKWCIDKLTCRRGQYYRKLFHCMPGTVTWPTLWHWRFLVYSRCCGRLQRDSNPAVLSEPTMGWVCGRHGWLRVLHVYVGSINHRHPGASRKYHLSRGSTMAV